LTSLAILAMAQQGSGDLPAAKQTLATAKALRAATWPYPERKRPYGEIWQDWLQAEILLREAEVLIPLTPSPLLAGDQIYIVSDNGIATCLNAETGRALWRGRLEGEYSASPVLAGGRIYFQNETGTTTVIQPGTSFRKLAENQIDGSTFASMAVIGKVVLLRSGTHLYRIEER
jgi:hypothetical protein